MKYRRLVLTSLRMAPAPERVGPTLQLPSGPILYSAPGEVILEALGQLQRPAERPGLRAQHLLLLQLPVRVSTPSADPQGTTRQQWSGYLDPLHHRFRHL